MAARMIWPARRRRAAADVASAFYHRDQGIDGNRASPLGENQQRVDIEFRQAVATGLGDVAVNYRYQVAGTERLSVAPRLSLLLPTGRAKSDLGAGALGVQANLPASMSVANQVVTHWNAGATVTPSAQNAVGDEATTVAYNLGASVVWLARPTFNFLVEVVWTREEAVTGPGRTAASDGLSISPGIRWAHNVSSGLQIVPGIAFPIGVGPSAGADAVFLYLSFEHPFRTVKR